MALPGCDDNEGGWPKQEALEVVTSLRGTAIAISDVVLFEPTPWGYGATEEAWFIDRAAGESDLDFGARSRAGAFKYILGCDAEREGALFVLTFPMWKDAA